MYVLVYITTSNFDEARRIGRDIVGRRLAACANIVERVHSTYWWKGKVEEASESLLILKSRKDKLEELIKTVKHLHTYENPAIVAIPFAGGSEDYLKWIGEEVR